MSEISPKAKLMLDWVFTEWSEKLASILESMADERPRVDRRGAGDGAQGPSEETLIWEQSFTVSEQPLLWVAAPDDVVTQIGERTLRAAGVETTDPIDARNTFLEVLSQSLSAFGQSLSTQLDCDAASTTGGPVGEPPPSLHWIPATLAFADRKLEAIWIACSPEMLDLLAIGAAPAQPEVEEPTSPPAPEHRESMSAQVPVSAGQSKTFDLLLDVSLSVSVSFGRTFLPIRDVLKLTTGSIVELDRGVSDPVEIIVNNCVIARGEVVVVEGNYGVRISQIASRHDRLKTGSTASEAQNALSGR